MFDAHAHLSAQPPADHPCSGWILPGLDAAQDAANAPLASDPRVHRAVGLHPWFLPALDALPAALDALEIRAAGAVAIGETGLDTLSRAGPPDVQAAAFRAQVALAAHRGCPLILHVVGRHGACLEVLREVGFPEEVGGMVHDFGGSAEVVAEWIAAGFMLSISPRSFVDRDAAAGVIRPDRIAMLARIPRDMLLVETDEFGIDRLPVVIDAVSRALDWPVPDVAAQTARNARRLFRLV